MKPRRAECIEIRAYDGAQLFRVKEGPDYVFTSPTSLWLSGIDRAPGVEVGDTGTMEYVAGSMRGYYRFVKDKAREGGR